MPTVWEAEAAPELRAQLASSLQVLQLAALEDGAVPAAIQRLDVLQGGGGKEGGRGRQTSSLSQSARSQPGFSSQTGVCGSTAARATSSLRGCD